MTDEIPGQNQWVKGPTHMPNLTKAFEESAAAIEAFSEAAKPFSEAVEKRVRIATRNLGADKSDV